MCTGVPKGTGVLLEFGGVTIVRDSACTVQGDGLQVCKTEYAISLVQSVEKDRLVSGLATWQAEIGAEQSWNNLSKWGFESVLGYIQLCLSWLWLLAKSRNSCKFPQH